MKTPIQASSAEANDEAATDALLMLKFLAQGETDIQSERTTAQNRVFADIKARLATADGD